MPNVAPAALVETLRRVGLLEPAQLDQLAQTLAELPREARPFAEELVRRGWLTPFQAKRLLEGLAAQLIEGEYVILERVGRGQVADVSRARHRKSGHEVALKVIRPDQRGDLQVMQRFRREVEAMSRLSHPNFIRAVDLEEIGTTHFYAMEFIAGVNLDQVIEKVGPLPLGPACDFARQTALGLQHAHEKGLIHRDLKPANLLLARPCDPVPEVREGHWGTVKVLDLGLARVEQNEAEADVGMGLTQEGFMLGTVDYMAPEQVTSPHEVDIRADVYALGCVTYHMLTGRPPFPGPEMIDKLNQHRTQEPARIEELRPEVPPALAGVVRKMMAKRPEGRYQTPREAAEVFGTVLNRLDARLLAFDWQLPGSTPLHSVLPQTRPEPEEAQPLSPAAVLVGILIFVGSFVAFWVFFAR